MEGLRHASGTMCGDGGEVQGVTDECSIVNLAILSHRLGCPQHGVLHCTQSSFNQVSRNTLMIERLLRLAPTECSRGNWNVT